MTLKKIERDLFNGPSKELLMLALSDRPFPDKRIPRKVMFWYWDFKSDNKKEFFEATIRSAKCTGDIAESFDISGDVLLDDGFWKPYTANYSCTSRTGRLYVCDCNENIEAEKARQYLEIIYRMVSHRNKADMERVYDEKSVRKFYCDFEYAKRINNAKSHDELCTILEEMNK